MLNRNTRHETVKLEEDTGKKFSNMNCSSVSLGQSPKAKERKAKMNRWNLIKLINCSTAKETRNKTKTTYRNGREGLTLQNTQNMLLSSYNSITKPGNPTTKRKWAEDLNRHFSKEDVKMADRRLERCSASLVIREMQIRTTTRYRLTLVRMAVIKRNLQTISAGWRGRKGSPPTLLVGR